MGYEHICEICKEKYYTKDKHVTKYCSDICRKISKGKHTLEDIKTCKECGSKFINKLTDFCSSICKNDYNFKNTNYNKICMNCGIEFSTHYKKDRFCCNQCNKEYVKHNNKKYQNNNKVINNNDNNLIIPKYSKGERELYNLLSELFSEYDILYRERYNWLMNPETYYPLELDIFVPDLNLAFEYDGEQHYLYNSLIFKTKEEFMGLRRRDDFKDKKCKERGITLIRFRQGVDTIISKEKLIDKLNQYNRNDIVQLIK